MFLKEIAFYNGLSVAAGQTSWTAWCKKVKAR